MRRFAFIALIVLTILAASAGLAAAADAPTPASNAVAIDTVWTLIATLLVFAMQAGFAMVEAGFTQAKNASNIVMKNLMDFAVASLVFWLVGFGLMFGKDLGGFIGTSGFMVGDSFEHLGLGIPLLAFLVFQTVFAGASATIVSGAMAERTRFVAYLLYSVGIGAVIYAVVGHWAWGGGWLAQRGFIDFAGSTVVHSVGGWLGLVGAVMLGPRLGKYGKVYAIPAHNITLGALGTFILWFGWFGFNPGSTLSGTTPAIAHIATTTNFAAAAGAVASMAVSWIKYRRPDVSMTLNGTLGGLVGITAGTAAVSPVGAVIIGLAAGAITVLAIEFLDRVLRVDDPVGAITVHAICGAFGTLAVGLFAVEGGLFYGGGFSLLVVQFIGVMVTFGWTMVTGVLLLSAINSLVGLRVSREEEAGLDLGEHGIEAYADFGLRDHVA